MRLWMGVAAKLTSVRRSMWIVKDRHSYYIASWRRAGASRRLSINIALLTEGVPPTALGFSSTGLRPM